MAKQAKKVQRRRHTRKPIAQPDAEAAPDLVKRRDDAVRQFNAVFTRALPQHDGSGQHARNGNYTQVEGDQYDGQTFDIPDGAYRVTGSDWVFVFEGGGFVEAMRATEANNYGGKDVIAVASGPLG